MHLEGRLCTLRPWRLQDEAALAAHANNRNIAKNLMDNFPHPYTRKDAWQWLTTREEDDGAPMHFAIVVDEGAVGGIGLVPGRDVHRKTMEIGY